MNHDYGLQVAGLVPVCFSASVFSYEHLHCEAVFSYEHLHCEAVISYEMVFQLRKCTLFAVRSYLMFYTCSDVLLCFKCVGFLLPL